MKCLRIHGMAAAALLALGLAGCAVTPSSGMGGGELSVNGQGNAPVIFSWQSGDGGISGSMVATLPTATYAGRFVQITHQTASTDLAPMWVGWNQGWGDWPYWTQPWPDGPVDVTRFGRYYSGKVVANLSTDGGQRMRCRLHLNDPQAGMAGGGLGECQLSGGRTISAVINRS